MLDLITILFAGLMTGTEFAVSAFVNPVLWKLDDVPQAEALSLLARLLGKIMPFWYALCLVLLIAEAYVHWHSLQMHWLLAAVLIWILAVLCSVTLLVPINNRIAQLNPSAPFSGWREAHKKWDTLHRWRIVMLVIATASLVWGLIPGAALKLQ